ncbi:hypothetical protein [Streptomyces sp. IBSNAI001]|uniref:hypothetical protein n=1 Tax=Streptomyces sp. IBSNAI001 TaxID=3457499 RepID=UPI003FD0242D
MFRRLKIRRAAAHLTEEFPEIASDVARRRACQMIKTYPHISAGRIGDYLVHGERIARIYEEAAA